MTRTDIKRNPFHPFSCFDTATLAGAALGQTVLAKAVTVAGLQWDASSAHSAPTMPSAPRICSASSATACATAFAAAQERARVSWDGFGNAEAPSDPDADRSADAGIGPIAELIRPRRRRAAVLQQLLQLAAVVHLQGDVAAADQFAVDVQLRVGRPVRVALERLAQLRLLEYVHVLELRADRRRAPTVCAEKPHCGKSGVPFMNSTTGAEFSSALIRSITSIVYL